jgi:hypothetical protein
MASQMQMNDIYRFAENDWDEEDNDGDYDE